MAVQPSTNSRSVPLYVLIIFVVLFLASTTGLVLLFVHQEDLRLESIQAQSLFKEYIGTRLKNSGKLETYQTMGKSAEPKQTPVEALLADRDRLAQMVTGNSASTSQDAVEKITAVLKGLSVPEASVVKQIAQSDLVGALQQAVTLIQSEHQQIQQHKGQIQQLRNRNNTITKSSQQLETKFKANTQKFLSQLRELKTLVDSYKTQYTQQLQTIKNQVSRDLNAKLTKLEKDFSVDIDELREIVKRNLKLMIASTRELGPAELRVAATITVDKLTQKIDGQILDLSGPVAYIDLGSTHKIKRGMRFVVISPTLKGQATPKVKAVIEVTSVGKLTSEARIVKSIPSEPILKGDKLINLIYDRELGLKFFVYGEFDLNKDKIMDPNGAQKVMEIVTTSGGTVSRQLSPAVNFVIFGKQLPKPISPGPGASASQEKQYNLELQKFNKYNDLKNQIQALAIPVISPEIFTVYSGYAVE